MPKTPWRSEKVRRPREAVEPFVAHLREHMPPDAEWHLGGSWRRGSPSVGDLDVVVVDRDLSGLEVAGFTAQKGGPQVLQGDLAVGGETIHLDFWGCERGQLGPFLWFITGPKSLNVAMRAVAARKGFRLGQYDLVDQRGVRLDDGTEEGVARVLGWRWSPPEDRDHWSGRRSYQQPAEHPRRRLVREVEVPASRGGTHTLRLEGGQATCSCPGYTYRKTCKHVENAGEYGLGKAVAS